MAKKVIVGGRIESKEVGGIVTGAAEILDDTKGKKQNVINQETDAELLRLDGAKQNNLTFDNVPTEGSNNPVKSAGVYAADKALSDAIEAILLLIPGAASALNKLVDTAMMNSSISTATASFRGTYNVVTDLGLTIDATHEQIAAKLAQVVSEADNNDYAFVQVPVSAESTDIRRTERYKFNGTEWAYEYDLNTSGFTAAQWAAINSGITIALVAKLNGLPTSSELMALLGQKQDTLTFDNIPTSGSNNPVKSGGVYSAINDEKTAREQLAQSVAGINGRLGNVEEVIPSGAAANNKLVANNSMEAYVASIIDAITASFTIATADGHINLTLTQTNGRVASLTLTSSDIASAQALTALTGRVSTAEGNITSLGGRVSTNETDIANLQQLYNNLQQSKPVAVTALPETGQQQGVIYRLAGTTSYSDYMWNGSTWVLMATYNNAIDPRPKKASQNLVTSGGVFDNMGALDVSELNATENPHTLAQYVDLSAALAAIPTDYQKGGMSIKFVQSSDNNYVQYFLTKDEWSVSEDDWEKMNLEEDVSQLDQEVFGHDNSQNFGFTIAVGAVEYSKSVNIKAGKYNITVEDSNNALPEYTRISLNGTSIGYIKLLTNPITISDDVTTIMLYASTSATTSGDIIVKFTDAEPVKSLSDRIIDVENAEESLSQEIGEVNSDVVALSDEIYANTSINWFQGSIYNGRFDNGDTRVTSAQPLHLPTKIQADSGIYIYEINRYKNGKSPATGGTLGTDFITESISLTQELVVYENESFPNVYISLRKQNSSDTLLIPEVESSVTVYNLNSLQARVSALEGPYGVIDFGILSANPSNPESRIWLSTPVNFVDFSDIILVINKNDNLDKEILIYAIYSSNPNDTIRLLPNISPSGKTTIHISSNDRKSLYGLLFYNLNNIEYTITATLTLVAKSNATKYLDTVEQCANILPNYYFTDDYIYKRRSVINKYLRKNILLGDAFFFVTDTHWEYNQKHSPAILKEVNKKLNIQKVFHGGDLYHNSPVVDTYETDCVNSYRLAIGNDKVAVAQGNHEYLGNDTWADVFVESSMHLENAHFGGENKQYFYIDNEIKKIRYIILYSYGQRVNGSYTYGYNDQEQMNWLSNVALSVETGWDIFLFTHYATSPSIFADEYDDIAGYNNLASIVNGYNGNGRIVAIITGHTHRDFVVMGRLDVPVIITTCDHNKDFDEGNGVHDFDNLQTPRTSGTINEQAFDAVIYDRDSCLLHFIRLGSEADNKMNMLTSNVQVACRSIYCTSKSVNDSIELPTYLTGTVSWESSDTSIATVSSGIVSCINSGCVRITATDSNGERQSFYIKIE